MKTTILQNLVIFIFISFAHSVYGLQPNQKANLYDHMLEINENWQNVEPSIYQKFISFNSDVDRIQMHLRLVEKQLLLKSTTHLTEKQESNRLSMLNVLHNYAIAKIFPINTGHSVRQPYFIDNFGTHCAVGFLVKESGFGNISKAISLSQNFAYVKEIDSPELVQWSKDFGFTLEELAWIQPTYSPTQSYSQIGQGSNGKVTHSETFQSSWFISGTFDSLDNLPCLNIGKYENGQLSCLGNGLDGEINDLTYHTSKGLIATGHILNNGYHYPFAKYLNNSWSFDSIPSRPNARATASWFSYSIIYVAIDHSTVPGQQEIWEFNNGTWLLAAIVHGKVNAMDYFDGLFGVFDSVDVSENNSWVTYTSKNALLKTNSGSWQAISGIVPDTIYAFAKINNFLYVGGATSTNSGASGALISGIINGIAQPIIITSDVDSTLKYAVYDMHTNDYTSIYISGDFKTSWGTSFCQNVGLLYPSSAIIKSMGYFDETVYSIGLVGQSFYLAGNFNSNKTGGMSISTYEDVNRLAKLEGYVTVNENDILNTNFIISPNPSQGNLSILNLEEQLIESIEILDLQGKVCHTSKSTNLNLAYLKAGTYFVRIKTINGSSSTKKWIKE